LRRGTPRPWTQLDVACRRDQHGSLITSEQGSADAMLPCSKQMA
jgi:hypothetical protein